MATAVARAAAPQAEAAREGENSRKAEAAKGRKRAKITPIVAPLPSSIGMPQISLKPLSLARSALLSGTRIQPSLMISQSGDAAEAEADRVASTIVSMPDPGPRPSNRTTATLHRSPLIVQRAPTANPTPANQADAETEAAVKKELSGGRPMAPDIQSFFGRRFNADFSGVRIHTDGRAENLSTRLGARAFTYGRHIFFNAGQYKPDSTEGATLVAHELTHTIQQSATIQRKEAAIAAPRVTSRSAPQAQRGIISDALDWFADKANYIPGFRLFTIIIGLNPINMSKVERSGANILRALIEFIPGGGLIVDALNNHGIFEKGGKFIEDQFASLGMVGAAFRDALMEFVDSLGWRDIFRLGSVWERAKRIFTAPVTRLIDFGRGLVSGIATIVKDAILKPLGKWASKNIPKWDLLVGVFGKNPISDEGESPAAAIIGGFMELIGQKEVYENIKKGNALGKAWNWFKSTFGEALALVMSIPGEVMATIRSLTIFDIVTIVGAFGKILGAFGAFVGKFITWAGGKVLKLLEIILEVVAPDVIPYLKKAGSAFSTIIKNPIRFVQTLVRAGKQGFAQFASNFLSHLQRSLVGWLTGAMAGANIYIPTGFSVMEILKFVLSILGLTWQNIRAKLVRATNETTVVALETGFDIVRTLVTQGPAAAWEKIVETIGNLKQMAIDAIMDFVKSRVVEAAVTKLVSMLNPAGAFIQALIGIYNTVMFFVERIRQIAQVAAAFIDGIAAIAAGNVSPAANKVETTMGGLLTLVISFLARIAGLGRVADAVTNLINRIRAPIDRALDSVVTWIVNQARRLGRFLLQAGTPADPNARLRLALRDSRVIAERLGNRISRPLLETGLAVIRTRYSLTGLQVSQTNGQWRIRLSINPVLEDMLREQIPVATDVSFTLREIIQAIDTVSQEFVARGTSEVAATPVASEQRTIGGQAQSVGMVDTRGRPMGTGAAAVTTSAQEFAIGTTAEGEAVTAGRSEQQTYRPTWRGVFGVGAGGARGRRYADLANSLGEAQVGEWMQKMARNERLPAEATPHRAALAELFVLFTIHEPSHGGGAARRDLGYSIMAIDLMSGPQALHASGVVGAAGIHPSAFGGAQAGRRGADLVIAGSRRVRSANAAERLRRERQMVVSWFERNRSQLQSHFQALGRPATQRDLVDFVRLQFNRIVSPTQ